MHDPYNQLVDEFPTLYPRLYRIVRARVPHNQEAEEIVSRTVETMLKRIGTFNPDAGDLGAWATGIAKHHILHYWRDRRDVSVLEDAERIAAASVSFNDVLDVDTLLGQLTPEQQALVILRYVDGYSAEELAPRLGKTAAALRQQLHRIKITLRSIVKSHKL